MPFTLEQRHKILTFLNLALLRNHQMQQQWGEYQGEFYHMTAKLNPTEYQANRPRPLLFEQDDIWKRLEKIERQSEFLVAQTLSVLSDLEAVETAIKQEQTSPNSALKKADVLEWDVSIRASGMKSQKDELIEKLRYFLELPPTPQSSNFGASLYRS